MHADATAIAAGSSYSMVLKQDGTVWATGDNAYGQLGNGTKTDRNKKPYRLTFVKVVPSGQCYTKGMFTCVCVSHESGLLRRRRCVFV